MSKFVRLSPDRVRSTEELALGTQLRVCVRGARGERVVLAALEPTSMLVRTLGLVVGGQQWDGAGLGGWVQCGTFTATGPTE